MPKTIHRLKITLRSVKPPVWRRIEVDSDVTLNELSDVLEAAMGWMGGHLHAFEAGGIVYEPLDPDGFGPRTRDEKRHRLRKVLGATGAKLRWDYDFGDGWSHDVVVEAIEPPIDGVDYPRCLTGRRACPPEDCGGPHGYGELLAALADPTHHRHNELADWLPHGFKPEAFDPEQATADMHAPRPLGDDWW